MLERHLDGQNRVPEDSNSEAITGVIREQKSNEVAGTNENT